MITCRTLAKNRLSSTGFKVPFKEISKSSQNPIDTSVAIGLSLGFFKGLDFLFECWAWEFWVPYISIEYVISNM